MLEFLEARRHAAAGASGALRALRSRRTRRRHKRRQFSSVVQPNALACLAAGQESQPVGECPGRRSISRRRLGSSVQPRRFALKRARSRRRWRNSRRRRDQCRGNRRARSLRLRVERREDWSCAGDRWSTLGRRRRGRPPGGPKLRTPADGSKRLRCLVSR